MDKITIGYGPDFQLKLGRQTVHHTVRIAVSSGGDAPPIIEVRGHKSLKQVARITKQFCDNLMMAAVEVRTSNQGSNIVTMNHKSGVRLSLLYLPTEHLDFDQQRELNMQFSMFIGAL